MNAENEKSQSAQASGTTQALGLATAATACGEFNAKYAHWLTDAQETPEQREAAAREVAEFRRRQEFSERQGKWRDASKSLGARYVDCRLDSFEVDEQRKTAFDLASGYAANMVRHVRRGDCIVLFGPPGTGKDHLLVSLLYVATAEHGFSGRWINGLDWFGDLRDAIDSDRSEVSMVRELSMPTVLAISDPLPPFGKLTDYQASMLFRVIDRRYRDMKPTWLTLNVSKGAEAEAVMGPAIVDRIRDRGLAIHCDWPSYRRSR